MSIGNNVIRKQLATEVSGFMTTYTGTNTHRTEKLDRKKGSLRKTDRLDTEIQDQNQRLILSKLNNSFTF